MNEISRAEAFAGGLFAAAISGLAIGLHFSVNPLVAVPLFALLGVATGLACGALLVVLNTRWGGNDEG